MITISPPHAALNAPRAPIMARMRYSYRVGRTESRQDIIDRIVHAAGLTPRGRLANVVISCHGNSSYLQLGEGFLASHGSMFDDWRGKVSKIWLRACLVGRNGTGGSSLPSRIARAARCHVVASTETQLNRTGRQLPYGQLDTFEGLVVNWGPSGAVTWMHRYRSGFQDSRGRWHGLNP